jgi:hypothetical protein
VSERGNIGEGERGRRSFAGLPRRHLRKARIAAIVVFGLALVGFILSGDWLFAALVAFAMGAVAVEAARP